MPADPVNKTDDTDLFAIHRATTNGFGFIEPQLEEIHTPLRFAFGPGRQGGDDPASRCFFPVYSRRHCAGLPLGTWSTEEPLDRVDVLDGDSGDNIVIP